MAGICRRLDGLPLAIELAAAWAPSLSVAEIADRLRDRFRLLVGRDPTAPDRHHTLRATIDWSYEALAPPHQLLFRRLSVFAGNFQLDAVEAVCPEDPDLLAGLAALVETSLVVADHSGPRRVTACSRACASTGPSGWAPPARRLPSVTGTWHGPGHWPKLPSPAWAAASSSAGWSGSTRRRTTSAPPSTGP